MDTSTHAQESCSLSISTISEDLTITGNVESKGELHLNPEVPGVEPQLNHDGHSETVDQRERGNGFIKSLPELLSA